MYSFPSLAAPLSRELPAYIKLHYHNESAGSCWVALLQTGFPESTSLFCSSSLLSVLCIMPQQAREHLGNSQPWLQMKSTKHCKFKDFLKKFWFII